MPTVLLIEWKIMHKKRELVDSFTQANIGLIKKAAYIIFGKQEKMNF